MQVALKAYGERGVLAYGLAERERAALRQAFRNGPPLECLEYVEGYDTILFVFPGVSSPAVLEKWLDNIDATEPQSSRRSRIHKMPVRYDGPDLSSVAEQTGLSEDEVVRLHSRPVYTVRMMGFSPGFPYLDGLDPRLHLPRKDSPRKRIPPGSVAIGGPHAGIYSVASPGGWHLLGSADVPLFDADAARGEAPDPEKVFLLAPGDQLRFHPVS